MKTLYHGSHVAVPEPLARAGRKNLDFGRGFYLTSIEEQAKAWAIIIAGRKGRNVNPVLNIYTFDSERAVKEGVRFKRFEAYNLEWLDYVVACRRGKDISADYDVVEGGVANDNVIDTVEDYEKGIITAEQALGQLRYKKVNHQLCILNQSVIDRYLKFTGSIILQGKEEEV
jgi:elongation factor P hydroxylase